MSESSNEDFSEKERLMGALSHDEENGWPKAHSRASSASTIRSTTLIVRSWSRRRWQVLAWTGVLIVGAILLAQTAVSRYRFAGSGLLYSQWRQASHSTDWSGIDTLFFFGDSYTSSVMEDLEKKPLRQMKKLELGDTGIYKRKPQWPVFWREVYSQKPVTAYNFAMGGSTVDSKIIRPFMAGSSLRDMVQNWVKAYGGVSPQAEWDPMSTLFVSWFGVNDVAMTHARNNETSNQHDRPPFQKVFESYAESVARVYASGGRKFLFLTCPPFDNSHRLHPSNQFLLQEKFYLSLDVSQFNARLYEMRDMLNSKYPDIDAAIFDAHRFWSRVIETPQEYEQTADVIETTEVCTESALQDMPVNGTYLTNTCKDGLLIRQHMWTDMHATYPIHNATAWKVVQDCMGVSRTGYCQ